ncbi:alginate export family protein [Marichromatium bheemlicum]|uniref:Alginate export family protein n=1 Tax=Marichromatium bheemlicum TaxID=365339 RepID=A0ABX1I4G7_9GAMM|nr:alginate export family protein [Marichromatium bheemlicum]NKN32435.1 alginate export family protein [Marichromatium bheemlicum]
MRCARLIPGLVVFAALLPAAPTQAADNAFDWGADLRLRQVFIGNVGFNSDSPTAERNFQRYRARLWGGYQIDPGERLDARLIWEGRHYVRPTPGDWPLHGFERNYSGGVLLDRLVFTLEEPGGLPLTLRLGRQDLIFGNGWLVLESSPFDGSRSIYFDAARATLALAGDTQLDLVYIDQSADTGRFPQALNGELEDQIEQHESGLILYARNRALIPGADLDGYFIYKHARPNQTPGNRRVSNGYPFPAPTDSGDVYAAGARLDTPLAERWRLRAEGVYEWGTRNGRDLDALGFNSRLTLDLGDGLHGKLHLDYEYLSGDDPDSAGDQAFDPLWGRWPQWSELMIYQWPLETRVGEASNLHRANLGWIAQLLPSTRLTLDYHALWADQRSTRSTAQLANLSGASDFRGHLFTARLKTHFNAHLAGHLVAEYLQPGDYYAAQRRDNGYFVRAELSLSW